MRGLSCVERKDDKGCVCTPSHRRIHAPATFQRLMQTVFQADMFNILLVYLDDIVVYSAILDEHLAKLDTVLSRLGMYGLKLKISKCSFFKKSVKYLGHETRERERD